MAQLLKGLRIVLSFDFGRARSERTRSPIATSSAGCAIDMPGVQCAAMIKILSFAALATVSAEAPAQSIAPGRWDVTSTTVDLEIPGAPGFLLRMMKGRSKTERKCVAPEQARTGVAAILVPDPKAQCRVDSLRIENGQYAQLLSCPQKKGAPLKLTRDGTYDATGFAGRVEVVGTTSRGAMRITLAQRAVHSAKSCGG